jgi:hypothetical protein
MNYTYKTVSFAGYVKDTEVKPDLVAKQLNNLINQQASSGWEFYQISSVNIYVNPGCLPALVGIKGFEKKYDMAIFRKVFVENNLENAKPEEKVKDFINNEILSSFKSGNHNRKNIEYLFKFFHPDVELKITERTLFKAEQYEFKAESKTNLFLKDQMIAYISEKVK